uniref:Uncharacterized protein n=1 Tax=Dromaius novaehollandiae TaxID=8790 RepID=A0A8C4KB60_DRONO
PDVCQQHVVKRQHTVTRNSKFLTATLNHAKEEIVKLGICRMPNINFSKAAISMSMSALHSGPSSELEYKLCITF